MTRGDLTALAGVDFTYRFPTIAEAVRGLACDSALLDGEAVALREDGRSDFRALLSAAGRKPRSSISYASTETICACVPKCAL
jgi:bifunctional non-homologous end joining protein LigD